MGCDANAEEQYLAWLRETTELIERRKRSFMKALRTLFACLVLAPVLWIVMTLDLMSYETASNVWFIISGILAFNVIIRAMHLMSADLDSDLKGEEYQRKLDSC